MNCSFDYKEAQVPEEVEDIIPNILLEGFRQTVVSKGSVVLRIKVERAEGFEKKKRTVFYKVQFSEFDEEGALLTEGRADRVEYEWDTKNATITGNIFIRSIREEGTLIAESLIWKDKERTLTSRPQERVRLQDNKGSWIEGSNFVADMRRLLLSFGEAVQGQYVE